MPPKYDGLELGRGPQSAPITPHATVETDPAAVVSDVSDPDADKSSATETATDTTAAGKATKRRRLASDTVIAGGTDGEELMKELDKVKKILGKYEDDEMEEMQKKVDALAQSLRTFKQRKEEIEKEHARSGSTLPIEWKAVPFSRLTWKHCTDRMGVTVAMKDVETDHLQPYLQSALDAAPPDEGSHNITSMVVESYWNTRKEEVRIAYHLIRVVSGNKPETQARMYIDQFLMALMGLFDRRAISLVFTELVLSSSDSSPAFVDWTNDRNQRFITFITGRVDYTVMTAISANSLASEARIAIQKAAENQTSSIITGIGNIITGSGLSIKNGELLQIFIIEAKRESEVNGLGGHIPQVIGECLAIMQKTGREYMAWCLTTGLAWYFGVTQRLEHLSQTRVYHTQLKRISAENDKKFNPTDMHIVFSLLAYWTLVPSNELVECFEGGENVGDF
ncbi:hypothetical protein AX16_010050 [Volvariella volvacea WC 439]|nr:hypothetical protein AX16_010050 [Volvariella volvacea WC 439]